jgi:lipopolysaccharide/colanic/teichoic acid biosynthesis glycosyltransferase
VSGRLFKHRSFLGGAFLKSVFAAAGAAALVGAEILWMLSARATRAQASLGLFSVAALHAVLVVLLAAMLSPSRPGRAWHYRLAFLLSLGGGVLQTLLGLLPGGFAGSALAGDLPDRFWLARLLAVGAGAFAGGLAISGLRLGLVEVNLQPSAALQRAVLIAHTHFPPLAGGQVALKRAFDILLAGLALLVSMPVWLLISFLIWMEDPGPLLFVKNSVGLGGQNFRQFKFRSMVFHAEQQTGPVLAEVNDQRALRFGRVMRKTALDELPQLVNILRGEMSFVGPRPQRTVLVYEYLASMPEYAARHAVRPGLAGLAQVVSHYYLTPRQKLRFDRVYIANMSLGFDLKLVILAFVLTFYYRWKKDWNGRLPRRLLRFGR